MRFLSAAILALAISPCCLGQYSGPPTIDKLAGGGLPENLYALFARLGTTRGLAVDGAGNVYIALYDYHVVLKLSPDSMITRVAGTGTPGFNGDNLSATDAQLNGPIGVAIDPFGNLYIADNGNNRVRKVSNGSITTVAGNGNPGFAGDDGPATDASVGTPTGVAFDRAGNLYVSDGYSRVREISNGLIATVAGNSVKGYGGDGTSALTATLNQPAGLALDASGNLYIADTANNRVRKVSNGIMTTAAGNGASGFSGDYGTAAGAQLALPAAVAVDPYGVVYIADSGNYRVRRIANGIITTFAGAGTYGSGGDGGLAAAAQLGSLEGIALSETGALYIADFDDVGGTGGRIRQVSGGIITTVAGGGFSLGDDGLATGAQLWSPSGVAANPAGDIYIADTLNNRVRIVSYGKITTVAGMGLAGYNGDNIAAASAQLNRPKGVAVDPVGNLYICDTSNQRVRKISGGLITTVAGNGTAGFSGDNGPAANAQLYNPYGIALDGSGNLYVTDSGNNRVRKISNGIITTIAGNGLSGYSGDGGTAISAQLNSPEAISVDHSGNVYIADAANFRVREVVNGIITTIAGNGLLGDDSPAEDAAVAPTGIAVDDLMGNIYITDTYGGNHTVRKISGGLITTVAGGGAGFAGDGGPAASAKLNSPAGITVGASGMLYIVDQGNQRVRSMTAGTGLCVYSISPSTLSVPSQGGVFTIAVDTGRACGWAVSGLPSAIAVSGTSSGVGSGQVTAEVASNPGAPIRQYFWVAGTIVAVTQAGSQSCAYSLGSGAQSFPAAGGVGAVNISTSSGCPWTASSSLDWVTNISPASGIGNGVVSFQVGANSGSTRTGAINIGGALFNAQQVGPAGQFLGSLAQVASGGLWTTRITLINNDELPATATLNFFDDEGNPLQLPLSSGSSGAPTPTSTIAQTLAPGASIVIQTASQPDQASVGGWAQLLATGNVSGFGVFAWNPGGGSQQAVVPLETRNPNSFVLYFDNTNGASEGVALANVAGEAAAVPVVIRDSSGTVLASTSQPLPPHGHTQFMVTGLSALTENKRGTLEFQTPSGGQISVLGIAAIPTGAITSVPATTK